MELDDELWGSESAATEPYTRAAYPARALSIGRLIQRAVVLDATAGSDAGIDVVSSEYATVAAEQTAAERLSEAVADQIVARLSLYAARTPAAR